MHINASVVPGAGCKLEAQLKVPLVGAGYSVSARAPHALLLTGLMFGTQLAEQLHLQAVQL